MRARNHEVSVRANGRFDLVDLTEELHKAVDEVGVVNGCVVAFCTHTTCSLLINELENGIMDDLRVRLDALVPKNFYYAHDDLDRRTQNLVDGMERKNGQAHIIQMIMGGSSQVLPIVDGKAVLGEWQRLFLQELDEPKDRRILFQVFGDDTA